MATRTPAQVFQDLIEAGFTTQQATTMTAIAGAESGYRDDALGDVGLENNTWGPSYGLFQIRTLKAATGTGTDRDVQALTGNDLAQAQAAYAISQQGRDFTPWTTFDNGAYQNFLSGAQNAAAAPASSSTSTVSLTSDAGSLLGSLFGITSTQIRTFGFTAAALVLATTLIGAAAVAFVGPHALSAGKTAVKVAAVVK